MKQHKKKIYFVVIAIVLLATTIFSASFSSAFQSSSFIGKGYYQFFVKNEHIGNLKNLDDLQSEMVKAYGDKIKRDVYLGEDVTIEHTPYADEVVEFSNPEKLLPLLDVQIDGLKVKTSTDKEFFVTSYHDWQGAIKDTIQFIKMNDEEKFNNDGQVKGNIQVVDEFRYENEKIPIEQSLNREEARQKIIFEDVFDIKTDIVNEGDTLDTVAERNGVSKAQVSYANNIDDDAILVPGAKLNVSEANYALSFSYPIQESIVEDVPYEIEYIYDDEKYKDEEEVIQQGINGQANASYLSLIINGESVPGERLSYEKISDPVKHIIKKGTKERPAAGAGGSAWSVGTDSPYLNEAGFIWPTIGICVSAEYGWYEYGAHKGIDIAGSTGESIWAAAAGTVEIAGYDGAFGNNVMVNHHNGLKTRYAHMTSIGVNVGEEVQQGKYLGGMGRTGFVDGVHLHFEVHADGDRKNPRPYLPSGGGPSSC